MSKKRILSDGHSSYWRNDIKKPTNEFKILPQDNRYMILTGIEGLKSFDKIMEEHFRKEHFKNE